MGRKGKLHQMIDLILGGVWPYILAAGALAAGVVGAYLRGRKDASDKAEKRATKTYIETRKEMDDANIPTHGADVDKWLRDRAKR